MDHEAILSRLDALEARMNRLEAKVLPPDEESIPPANVESTIDILGLAVECEIPQDVIKTWSQSELEAASDWAAQQHLLASDNDFDDDEILAKPVHVRKLEETNPKRKEIGEVKLERTTKR